MKHLSTALILCLSIVLMGSVAWGQVSLTTMGSAYTQNFDALTATGTSTTTIPGWFVGTGTAAASTTVTVGTGSSTAGGNYNFGVAGTNPLTDRALGSLCSSSTLRNTEVRFTNNTGAPISALTISYTGEQWRLGQTGSAETGIVAYYSTDGTNYAVMGASYNFVPPITTGTAGPLDGNLPANRSTGRGGTYIPSSAIASGATFYLRWVDTDNSGSDAANAIDDFSLTPLATAPTVNFYSKSTGNLDVLGTWGTNADGTGTVPSSFTNDFQIFNIVNNTTPAIGASWTVSGSSSKIVVGDGGTGINFVVPASSTVTGTVDITASSIVTVQNATPPTWGVLASTSTVVYNPGGTLSVQASTYGNLTLLGGTQTFAAGTATVTGNLLLDGVSNVTGPSSGFSTVNLAGNLTAQNGATFNANPTPGITLVCNGTGAQTLTGNGADIVVFRLTTSNAAGVSLSNTGGTTNLLVGNSSGGGVTFSSGNLALNNNTITFQGKGAILSSGGTFTGGAGSNMVLNTTATTFGSLGFTPGAQTLNNLTIAAVTALTLNSNLTVNGTFTLTSGAITPGTGVLSYGASGTLTYNGALAQLSTNAEFPSSNGPANLTLNNAAGLTLHASRTVGGSLTLTNGIITTGANTLTVTATGSIAGASASSYIDGKLSRIFAAPGSLPFPIGKGGNYRPLSFNYTALTGTSSVTAEQFESGFPGVPPSLTNQVGTRYWNVTQTGGTGYTYDITLDPTGLSFAGIPRILKHDSGTTLAFATTTPNYTATGLNTLSDFTFGEMLPPIHNITQNTFYTTIQSAVTAANPGDQITAAAGTYNERVTITKPLNLQGDAETTTILDGTGLVGAGSGIIISSGITNVTIKNLTVQNYSGTSPNSFAGIYAVGQNNNLMVQNVTLKNNIGGSGFYANGPVNGVTLDNLDVSGHPNTFGAARGIVIWNGLKENITITNCDIYNNNCCGIELQDGTASGVTFQNNNIHDNGDNGIGVVGLQGPGENLIKLNTLANNGRFGIEVRNPNGSGVTTGAGRIVVENNSVSRSLPIGAEVRDLAGIAVYRRAVLPGNVDVPTGVVVQNNTVSGYVQPSTSDGFGIVAEGMNHTISGNIVNGCDVGIQRQAGHLPYPGDGDQSNVADTYFGRGNSPVSCGITVSGNTLSNTVDTRDVGAGVAGGLVVNTSTAKSFCSIQTAIDDALTLSGNTIQVGAGVYHEQVYINKDLTLHGAGASVTTVAPPATLMNQPFLPDRGERPIIGVGPLGTNVTIEGFTVDGEGAGNTQASMSGIQFFKGSGIIRNNTVTRVRATPFDGTQGFIPIFVGHTNDVSYTHSVEIANNTVVDYGKSGIVCNEPGLTANIHDNSVTGQGPTPLNAQNGIQIGWGATGTIAHNTISAISYTGPSWSASGIVLPGSGGVVDINNNAITNAQVAVYPSQVAGYTFAANVTMSSNTISASSTGVGRADFYGVVTYSVDGAMARPADGKKKWKVAPFSPAGMESHAGPGSNGRQSPMATMTFDCSGNSFVSTDAPPAGAGLYLLATSTSPQTATLTNNTITGWDAGVVTDKDAGATLTSTLRQNLITGNTWGMYDFTNVLQDAKQNWWGDATGPNDNKTLPGVPNYSNPTGLGNPVSSDIDYSPFYLDAARTTLSVYTLTLNATTGGTAVKVPDQATYNHGTVVTLTATADPGYHFVNWTGDITGTTNPLTFAMTGSKTVTANFIANTATPIHNITLNTYYTTIQSAVDAANPADEIDIAAGTFEEQVEITKPLTLQGAGMGTIVKSPVTLTKYFTTSANNYPVIYVHDADGVVIRNLAVDGAGRGNSNYRFDGIAYHNAGGTVEGCQIKDIRETPINGNQHGVALYAYADNGTNRALLVTTSVFTGFQKNAMALGGNNLTANVSGNTVTGAGAIAFTAQNGIQIGYGATGTVTGNTVAGFSYTPGTDVATGILLYNAGATIATSTNTVHECQLGIYYINVGGTISGNIVSATATGTGATSFWGIDVDPGKNLRRPVQAFDEGLVSGGNRRLSGNNVNVLTTTVSGNTLTGDGTNGTGLEFDALGTETLNATATNNDISAWGWGVYFYKEAGATLNAAAHSNRISGNVVGAYDSTGVLQDAKENWWGNAAGPLDTKTLPGTPNYSNPTGLGNPVSSYIDYSPFYLDAARTTLSVYTLTLNATTGGTVAKVPDQTTYNHGTVVTVTASGLPGYHFDQWSGGATGSTNPLTLTMTGSTTVTANFVLDAQLGISTTSPLPAATAGTAYSQTLTATGGIPPYGNWQVISGSLPAGLNLNSSTGEINGTPTVAGTSTFTVQVSDAALVNGPRARNSAMNTATKVFDLTVVPGAVDHFVIGTVTSPQMQNVAFNLAMTAKDANNNTVTGFVSTVSIGLSSGTISPTTSAAFINGTRTEPVTVSTPGTGVTIIVGDGSGHTGTSNAFSITSTVVTSIASGNWSAGTTWDQGSKPSGNQSAVIASGHIVTLTASDSCAAVTVNGGGVLDIATFALGLSGTYTIAAGGEGRMSNFNPIPGRGTTPWAFDAASTYMVGGAATGFSIGTATGITFGNLNWASTGNATPPVGVVVQGNLVKSNAGQLRGGTGTGTSRVIVVHGNVIVNGGTLYGTNSTSPITGGFDIDGDLTINAAGTLGMNLFSGAATIKVGGNVTVNDGGQVIPGAGSGACLLFFKGTGTSTFDPGSVAVNTFKNIGIPAGKTVTLINHDVTISSTYTLADTGTLNLGTNAVKGAGGFSLVAGATLGLGSPAGITSTVATGNIQVAGTRTFDPAASYTYNGSLAQVTGDQLPLSVNSLTIDNAAGVTLTGSETINGILGLTAGTLTTGVNSLSVSASGTVSRTTGYIFGNLTRFVATGPTASTFDIGDAAHYTPVTIAFNSVATAGNLTATTTSTGHPQIATSGIDPAKSVNRYYTLANSGIGFDEYSAVFVFAASDVDAGANTANFVVGKYDSPSWTLPAVGTRTATSTQATGMTSFSDFAIGEPVPADVTPPTIVYNLVSSSATPGAPVVSAMIKDNVGLDVTVAGKPRLWYRSGSVLPLSGSYSALSGVEISGDTSWTFTFPSLASGTFVEYYVAAQDDVPNVITEPAGTGYTANPPNGTVATPNRFVIASPLTFTVGAAGASFPSITEGLTWFNGGIDGPMQFLLNSDYTSVGEVYPIFIGGIPGLGSFANAVHGKGVRPVESSKQSPVASKKGSVVANRMSGDEIAVAGNLPAFKSRIGEMAMKARRIPGLGKSARNALITNTFTIKPNAGATPGPISGNAPFSSSFAILWIDAVDGVTIDGLTLANAGDGPTVFISDGASNNRIINSTLKGVTGAGNAVGIVWFTDNVLPLNCTNNLIANCTLTDNGGGRPYAGITYFSTPPVLDVNDTVRNCTFQNFGPGDASGGEGIWAIQSTSGLVIEGNDFSFTSPGPGFAGAAYAGVFLGSSGTGPITGSIVRNNTIHDIDVVAASALVAGISAGSGTNVDGALIEGNTISNLGAATSASTGVRGFYVAAGLNQVFTRNVVKDLQNTLAGGAVQGLRISGAAGGQAFKTTWTNNVVVLGNVGSNGNVGYVGIADNGNTDDTAIVAFNSVYIGGAATGGTTSAYTRSAPSVVTLRNNIFMSERDGGVKNYGIRSTPATGGIFNSDYNDVYVTGATTGVFGAFAGVDQATLAAWQTASAGDAHSLNADPVFVDPTTSDLHIRTFVGDLSPVANVGVPFDGVAVDIDNEAGHRTTTPDIGADEFTMRAPVAFNMLTPVNGAAAQPLGGSLTWDPAVGATVYDIFLDTNPVPVTLLAGNVAGTTAPYTGLATDLTYRWTVVAKNSDSSTAATGSPFHFATILSTVTVGVPIDQGWNMVSNPVRATNDSVRALYPASDFMYAFSFTPNGPSAGYNRDTTMENGTGYWGRFPAAMSQTVTGLPRTRDSISVVAGWNIVGTISNPVDTNTIVSDPAGLKLGSWFGFSATAPLPGYSPAETLVPGRAYWIKSSGAGRFVLANPVVTKPAKGQASGVAVKDVLNSLTITDSKGHAQTLYFGADANNQVALALYDLPPAPPAGVLDARFATADGGSMVRTHAVKVSEALEFPVTIRSDAYPLTISWNVSKGTASYEMTDGAGGHVFLAKEMKGEGSMKITNTDLSRVSVRLLGDGTLPTEYALSQNYPNPFNPTTNIKYALPVQSKVMAEVYNLLGQRVRTLVNDDQPAGYHLVAWDGTGNGNEHLASGTYFLRLSATGTNGKTFNEIRKLLLLK